jgi:pimeloyl-ACP methyl ester carboxylesterase
MEMGCVFFFGMRELCFAGREELKGLPCFLFGESMGGAVALRAHLKEPAMWDGAVLVAPMCKIADSMYPPWIVVQILLTLARVIPKAKLVPGNHIAAIGFRDPEKRKLVRQPPSYCHENLFTPHKRIHTQYTYKNTCIQIHSRVSLEANIVLTQMY